MYDMYFLEIKQILITHGVMTMKTYIHSLLTLHILDYK